MKKVKYVIKATKFKDNTYEDVVFENQPLSQKQETFSDVKHILDLDFENALDEGKKPNNTCHQWEWRYTGLWFDN